MVDNAGKTAVDSAIRNKDTATAARAAATATLVASNKVKVDADARVVKVTKHLADEAESTVAAANAAEAYVRATTVHAATTAIALTATKESVAKAAEEVTRANDKLVSAITNKHPQSVLDLAQADMMKARKADADMLKRLEDAFQRKVESDDALLQASEDQAKNNDAAVSAARSKAKNAAVEASRTRDKLVSTISTNQPLPATDNAKTRLEKLLFIANAQTEKETALKSAADERKRLNDAINRQVLSDKAVVQAAKVLAASAAADVVSLKSSAEKAASAVTNSIGKWISAITNEQPQSIVDLVKANMEHAAKAAADEKRRLKSAIARKTIRDQAVVVAAIRLAAETETAAAAAKATMDKAAAVAVDSKANYDSAVTMNTPRVVIDVLLSDTTIAQTIATDEQTLWDDAFNRKVEIDGALVQAHKEQAKSAFTDAAAARSAAENAAKDASSARDSLDFAMANNVYSIRLKMDFAKVSGKTARGAFEQTFKVDIAKALVVDVSRVEVLDVRAGSIIVSLRIKDGAGKSSSDAIRELENQVATAGDVMRGQVTKFTDLEYGLKASIGLPTPVVDMAKIEKENAVKAAAEAEKFLYDSIKRKTAMDATVVRATQDQAAKTAAEVADAKSAVDKAAADAASSKTKLQLAIISHSSSVVIDKAKKDAEDAVMSVAEEENRLAEVIKRKAAIDASVVRATQDKAANTAADAADAKAAADKATEEITRAKNELALAVANNQPQLIIDMLTTDQKTALKVNMEKLSRAEEAAQRKADADKSVQEAAVQSTKTAAATLAKVDFDRAKSAKAQADRGKAYADNMLADAKADQSDAQDEAINTAKAVADNVLASSPTAVEDAAKLKAKLDAETAATKANARKDEADVALAAAKTAEEKARVDSEAATKAASDAAAAAVPKVDKTSVEAAAKAGSEVDAAQAVVDKARADLKKAINQFEKAVSDQANEADLKTVTDSKDVAAAANTDAMLALAGANKKKAAADKNAAPHVDVNLTDAWVKAEADSTAAKRRAVFATKAAVSAANAANDAARDKEEKEARLKAAKDAVDAAWAANDAANSEYDEYAKTTQNADTAENAYANGASASLSVDCGYKYKWQGACTKTCAGGTQWGKLVVTRAPEMGGRPCPLSRNGTRSCNTQECPTKKQLLAAELQCVDVNDLESRSELKRKLVTIFLNNVFWVTGALVVLVIIHWLLVKCMHRSYTRQSLRHTQSMAAMPVTQPRGNSNALKNVKSNPRLKKTISHRIVEKALPSLAMPRLELLLMIVTYQGVCLSAFSALHWQMTWYVVIAGLVVAIFPLGLLAFTLFKLRFEIKGRKSALYDSGKEKWESVIPAERRNKKIGSPTKSLRKKNSRKVLVKGLGVVLPPPYEEKEKEKANDSAPGLPPAYDDYHEVTEFDFDKVEPIVKKKKRACVEPLRPVRDAPKVGPHGEQMIASGRRASLDTSDGSEEDVFETNEHDAWFNLAQGDDGPRVGRGKNESFRQKAKRLNVGIVEKYGILFDDFKPNYYLWKIPKLIVQMLTGFLLSGLASGALNALTQSIALMVINFTYGLAVAICRPHVNTSKNLLDIFFASGYSLLFLGSALMVKADCWGINVSDIEVYMIVVSGFLTVSLIIKIVTKTVFKIPFIKRRVTKWEKALKARCACCFCCARTKKDEREDRTRRMDTGSLPGSTGKASPVIMRDISVPRRTDMVARFDSLEQLEFKGVSPGSSPAASTSRSLERARSSSYRQQSHGHRSHAARALSTASDFTIDNSMSSEGEDEIFLTSDEEEEVVNLSSARAAMRGRGPQADERTHSASPVASGAIPVTHHRNPMAAVGQGKSGTDVVTALRRTKSYIVESDYSSSEDDEIDLKNMKRSTDTVYNNDVAPAWSPQTPDQRKVELKKAIESLQSSLAHSGSTEVAPTGARRGSIMI